MRSSSVVLRWALIVALFCAGLANAHSIIVYPGYRGNNLFTNGTVQDTNGLGQGFVNGSWIWPYGMQWAYPCGGLPTSTNRTKWPVQGGAISFQPGWFQGHKTALIYLNLGLGALPANMSHPMLPPFQLIGPSNNPYPGTFCMPQVPLPANITVNEGDFATIQVIETAVHGASLYNCVDIEFAKPQDCAPVTKDNCFNSSDIQFADVYTTASLTTSGATSIRSPAVTLLAFAPILLVGVFGFWS